MEEGREGGRDGGREEGREDGGGGTEVAGILPPSATGHTFISHRIPFFTKSAPAEEPRVRLHHPCSRFRRLSLARPRDPDRERFGSSRWCLHCPWTFFLQVAGSVRPSSGRPRRLHVLPFAEPRRFHVPFLPLAEPRQGGQEALADVPARPLTRHQALPDRPHSTRECGRSTRDSTRDCAPEPAGFCSSSHAAIQINNMQDRLVF